MWEKPNADGDDFDGGGYCSRSGGGGGTGSDFDGEDHGEKNWRKGKRNWTQRLKRMKQRKSLMRWRNRTCLRVRVSAGLVRWIWLLKKRSPLLRGRERKRVR